MRFKIRVSIRTVPGIFVSESKDIAMVGISHSERIVLNDHGLTSAEITARVDVLTGVSHKDISKGAVGVRRLLAVVECLHVEHRANLFRVELGA